MFSCPRRSAWDRPDVRWGRRPGPPGRAPLPGQAAGQMQPRARSAPGMAFAVLEGWTGRCGGQMETQCSCKAQELYRPAPHRRRGLAPGLDALWSCHLGAVPALDSRGDSCMGALGRRCSEPASRQPGSRERQEAHPGSPERARGAVGGAGRPQPHRLWSQGQNPTHPRSPQCGPLSAASQEPRHRSPQRAPAEVRPLGHRAGGGGPRTSRGQQRGLAWEQDPSPATGGPAARGTSGSKDGWVGSGDRAGLGPGGDGKHPGAPGHPRSASLTFPLPAACQNHTRPPSVYLLLPPLQGLWLRAEATFTCLAVGQDLQEARLSWAVAEEPQGGRMEEGPTEHTNGSWSLSSRLALPRSSWAAGAPVTCRLSGPGLRSLVTAEARREHAALAPSNLAVRVLTAPGPLAFTKAASWLLCEVSSFSPLDILLTWLEGQQEVDPSWFATARPAAQPGNPTFRTWSVLRVPASPGHQDATYTCVVGHEASRTLLNASWRLDTGLATLTPGSQDEGSDDYVDLEDAGRLWLTFTVLFLVTLLYSGFVTFLKVK
uniref:Ig-like domain-containing protein n=1 Tax=Sus scrofa TaxID=9823 RepID=A0A4X1U088_PIG